MKIPSVHIEAKRLDEIAKTVIMPGDPLRAKFIADNFLSEVVCFNTVRGMLGYTGYYHGKKLSVMASGMGCPSIGIYSYELFEFYKVDNIIRVGSCGSYVESCNLHDLLLVTSSYSDSSFAQVFNNDNRSIISSSDDLNIMLKQTAAKLDKQIKEVRAYTTDVFYSKVVNLEQMVKNNGCSVVEMECFALFAIADFFNKRVACLLTVSDSLITLITALCSQLKHKVEVSTNNAI